LRAVEPVYARELLSDGAGAAGYLLKDRVGDRYLEVHGGLLCGKVPGDYVTRAGRRAWLAAVR
jgi:hypothetical protein